MTMPDAVDLLRFLAAARRQYAARSVREEHATAALLADILGGTVDPVAVGWLPQQAWDEWKERTA